MSILESLKNELTEMRKKGLEKVFIDSLLAFLESPQEEGEASPSPGGVNIEQFRAINDASLESFRSTIAWGQTSVNSSFFLNGGACVALLAFIGSIWSKSALYSEAVNIVFSLKCFAFGVLATTISSGASYFSQGYYTHAIPETIRQGDHDRPQTKKGHCWKRIAIALIIFSYCAFFVGVFSAATAMKEVFLSSLSIQSISTQQDSSEVDKK
ncbi:MAG: hypothetical protein JW836_09595 [Deltaproteobacteria bacterium]|nr:hypothetical protein [Deltaproteobacteria bacterium]